MVKPMEGKVALVTGGSSGIGRATALDFAREGARVAIADVDSAGGSETLRLIETGGGQGIFIKTNVSQEADVAAMVEKTVQTYGCLDYAHNNAGVEPRSMPVTEVETEVWDKVLSVNLKGVWLCLKYEIRQMLKQGRGAIVNTSSLAGLDVIPNCAPYIASKFGVIGLTKAAAVENTRFGIRVNVVCPGPTDTPMMDRIIGQAKTESQSYGLVTKDDPIGRMGTPEDVARTVVWLCSDAASFINGCALPVDGGRLLF
jgi:NAD(P)-dependent dehydrogenase (short-subunit alcohol dehydrogenase family)